MSTSSPRSTRFKIEVRRNTHLGVAVASPKLPNYRLGCSAYHARQASPRWRRFPRLSKDLSRFCMAPCWTASAKEVRAHWPAGRGYSSQRHAGRVVVTPVDQGDVLQSPKGRKSRSSCVERCGVAIAVQGVTPRSRRFFLIPSSDGSISSALRKSAMAWSRRPKPWRTAPRNL